jgi:hypothetical protein
MNDASMLSENLPIRPERIVYAESPRLRRIRVMSRLLDSSIVLPGGYRIGIDPIVGLIPGFGDFIGAALSFYLVYEAARLGLPKRVLLRMCGNVLIEVLVGEIPLLGDVFDAVWKGNLRNARLVEMHYRPTQPERPLKRIFLKIFLLFLAVLFCAAAFGALLIWLAILLIQHLIK